MFVLTASTASAPLKDSGEIVVSACEVTLHIDLTKVVSLRELHILTKTLGTERNTTETSLGNRNECFLQPLNVKSNV